MSRRSREPGPTTGRDGRQVLNVSGRQAVEISMDRRVEPDVALHPEDARGGASVHIPMSLEMRDRCERCGRELVPDGTAYICSYECTFCESCAGRLEYHCPNCGGELVRRPRRRGGV